jgi:hypothetical protein
MRANVYTLDQVTRTASDLVANLTLQRAMEIAHARCLDLCEDERPHQELVEGKGVIFRNHGDFIEVVEFIREKEDVQAQAA